MDEKEFEKYLKKTKKAIEERDPDIRGRMWFLVGWISAEKKVFTGKQIGRLFQLVYPDEE